MKPLRSSVDGVTRFLLLMTCASIVVGCRRESEPVWVDIDSVLAESRTEAPVAPILPAPPPSRPSQRIVIPGRPARTLEDPSNAGSLNVTIAVEEAQRRGAKALAARLIAYYERAAARFAAAERRRAGDPYRKHFDAVAAEYRQAFEDYAAARAPLVERLAFLVGWPDPNPLGTPLPNDASETDQAKAKEASKLRAANARALAEYELKCQAIYDRAIRGAGEDQYALVQRMTEHQQELRERAQREAEAEVAEKPRELGLRLAAPNETTLAPTPTKVVRIPAESPFDPAPQVQSKGTLNDEAGRRRALMSQLRIWLALHRYAFAVDSRSGRNATAEFQRWRELRMAGP